MKKVITRPGHKHPKRNYKQFQQKNYHLNKDMIFPMLASAPAAFFYLKEIFIHVVREIRDAYKPLHPKSKVYQHFDLFYEKLHHEMDPAL